MIFHDSFQFKEKVSRLMSLETEYREWNEVILEHGQHCGVCISAQINAGFLPEMVNPILIPAESAEEYYYVLRN